MRVKVIFRSKASEDELQKLRRLQSFRASEALEASETCQPAGGEAAGG